MLNRLPRSASATRALSLPPGMFTTGSREFGPSFQSDALPVVPRFVDELDAPLDQRLLQSVDRFLPSVRLTTFKAT